MKSKRIFINLVATLLTCLFTVAQSSSQSRFLYAADVALNFSFFDKAKAPFPEPDLVSEYKRAARTNFEIGGMIEYSATSKLRLVSGIKYAGKGGSYKVKNPDVVWVTTYNYGGKSESDAYNFLRYRLNYVEVPLLLKLVLFKKLKGSHDWTFAVYGGTSGMINLGSSLRYNYFEGDDEEWDSFKIKAAEQIVANWKLGAEYGHGGFTDGGIRIYVEYSQTLGNVYDVTQLGFDTFDVSMSTVAIGIRFDIDMKKNK